MTNIAVHKWWWGVLTPIWFAVFVYASVVLAPLLKGMSPIDLWNSHNLRVIFLSGAAGVLRTFEGAMRFTTGIYVGESFYTTFLSAWAGFLFWGQLGPLFLEQVLTVIIKSVKMSGAEGELMKKNMERMRTLINWQLPQVTIAYLSLLATYFVDDPFVASWLVASYYLWSTLTSIFFVFVIAMPIMSAFMGIIESANPEGSDAKLASLQKKIFIFHREVRNNGFSNTLTCIVFCVPFTRTMVTYQLAFGWTIGALINLAAIWFIRPKNAKKKVTPSGVAKSTVVD
jgi:hypothetical protein